MLPVVQTATWDWEPPHISGYPHLPPAPPQYPPPHAHRQPQHSYHQDQQWQPYPPLPRPPPPRLCRMARCPPPPPPTHGAPPFATSEPPKLQPKALLGPFADVAHVKKVLGRLRCLGGTNLIVCPPLQLSMRGLYGAVGHMYADPRSVLPNVLHLGGPPCVSTGSAGDRRDAGRPAPSRNGRNQRRCHGGPADCCAGCSPRVLVRHL